MPGTVHRGAPHLRRRFPAPLSRGRRPARLFGGSATARACGPGAARAVLSVLPAHLSRRWLSGFVQDEVRVGHGPAAPDRSASKIEHNDYTGVEFSPAAAWPGPCPSGTWCGAPSRAPSERHPRSTGASSSRFPAHALFLIAGGPNFVSEERAGLRARLSERAPRPAVATVATFYNDYDHLRSLERLAPPAPFPLVFANGQTRHVLRRGVDGGVPGHRLVAAPVRLHGTATSHPPGARQHGQDLRQHGIARSDALRDVAAVAGPACATPVGCRISVRRGRSSITPVPAYGELDDALPGRRRRARVVHRRARISCTLITPNSASPATRKEAERSVYGKIVWRF